MTSYTTIDGDMVDAVCRRHYGRRRGAVEAVLAANPGLAAQGPLLPAGVEILLPDLPDPAPPVERLWD